MINTLKPSGEAGHDAQRGEILERISKQYGKPEEKQREAVKKLGKDEFFKIMVTQIQHQDPLKPYQNEQMAAQLAQFSSLEQMMNVNNNLEKLAQAQQPLHHLGAAGLIGKYVTTDSGRLFHTEGKYSEVEFELPVDAAKVRATLVNERGETVREFQLEGLKKGPNKIEWDGKKSNNFAASSGMYMVQISAETTQGKPLQVDTHKTALVHGVAYEGKETVLLTGEVNKPARVPLKNVYKIVDPSQKKAEEGAVAVPGAMGGITVDPALLNGGQAGGQEGEPPSPDAMAEMINQTDRNVPGLERGLESKYAPVDPKQLLPRVEKPVPEQRLSNAEITRALNERPDLSEANPVAEALRAGNALAGPGPKNTDPMADANPMAARIRSQGGVPPEGNSLPTGVEGSVAGKWNE